MKFVSKFSDVYSNVAQAAFIQGVLLNSQAPITLLVPDNSAFQARYLCSSRVAGSSVIVSNNISPPPLLQTGCIALRSFAGLPQRCGPGAAYAASILFNHNFSWFSF